MGKFQPKSRAIHSFSRIVKDAKALANIQEGYCIRNQ